MRSINYTFDRSGLARGFRARWLPLIFITVGLVAPVMNPQISRGHANEYPNTAKAMPVDERKKAEAYVERLDRHRLRLEARLSDVGQQIERLKAQRRTIRRNARLERALRNAQEIAGKLSAIIKRLTPLRRRLLSTYRAIAMATRSSESERAAAHRKYNALAADLRAADHTATQPRALKRILRLLKDDSLDGPDELDERADLLSDSADKIARHVRLLKQRIAAMRQRAALQRHAIASDDSPFIENTSRRLGRALRRTRLAAAPTTGQSAAAAPTAEQSAGNGSQNDAPSTSAPTNSASEPAFSGDSHVDPGQIKKSNDSESAAGPVLLSPAGPSLDPRPIGNPATPRATTPRGATPPSATPEATPRAANAPSPRTVTSGPSSRISTLTTLESIIDPSILRVLRGGLSGNEKILDAGDAQRATIKLDRLARKLEARAKKMRARARNARKTIKARKAKRRTSMNADAARKKTEEQKH